MNTPASTNPGLDQLEAAAQAARERAEAEAAEAARVKAAEDAHQAVDPPNADPSLASTLNMNLSPDPGLKVAAAEAAEGEASPK